MICKGVQTENIGVMRSMIKEWEKVRQFHYRFGHPVSDEPVMLSQDRVEKRYMWMLEELDELRDATNVVEQADAIIDLIYFALGTLVEMGIEPDELFQTVHNANMKKLWEDGKPHYDKNGKTIKPNSWKNPYEQLELIIYSMQKKRGQL